MSRSYRRHLTAADRRAKEIIKGCVASGAGIEFIEDAPRFRYSPAEFSRDPYQGREDRKPSGRGSIPCGKGNPLKLKNWSPSKLDANPMYRCAMAGDGRALTLAREAWADGDPGPLRKYLAEQAENRKLRDELFADIAA